MPTDREPVTLAQIVHRAGEVVDPQGADADVVDFVTRFEDDDEPVAGLREVIEQRFAEAAGELDPEQESGALQITAAVATYLAFRRDEAGEPDADELVRLAVRAEFHTHRPEPVSDWLSLNGVNV
jgi:hypothetical protein